jgi:hypothetical protein
MMNERRGGVLGGVDVVDRHRDLVAGRHEVARREAVDLDRGEVGEEPG